MVIVLRISCSEEGSCDIHFLQDSGDEHIREPYAVAFNNSDQMLVVENSPPSILKLSNTGLYFLEEREKGE